MWSARADSLLKISLLYNLKLTVHTVLCASQETHEFPVATRASRPLLLSCSSGFTCHFVVLLFVDPFSNHAFSFPFFKTGEEKDSDRQALTKGRQSTSGEKMAVKEVKVAP